MSRDTGHHDWPWRRKRKDRKGGHRRATWLATCCMDVAWMHGPGPKESLMSTSVGSWDPLAESAYISESLLSRISEDDKEEYLWRALSDSISLHCFMLSFLREMVKRIPLLSDIECICMYLCCCLLPWSLSWPRCNFHPTKCPSVAEHWGSHWIQHREAYDAVDLDHSESKSNLLPHFVLLCVVGKELLDAFLSPSHSWQHLTACEIAKWSMIISVWLIVGHSREMPMTFIGGDRRLSQATCRRRGLTLDLIKGRGACVKLARSRAELFCRAHVSNYVSNRFHFWFWSRYFPIHHDSPSSWNYPQQAIDSQIGITKVNKKISKGERVQRGCQDEKQTWKTAIGAW